MWTLGLSHSHNGAACLVHDGRVQVAIQLERLERIKRHRLELGAATGPDLRRAINYCLRATGISFSDIDAIAASTPKRIPKTTTSLGDIAWVPHHLAHAEYALHYSDLRPGIVLIVDGHGTDERDRACFAVTEQIAPGTVLPTQGSETVSIYRFDGEELQLVSRSSGTTDALTARETASIGSVWQVASRIVFGHEDQAGKLMGLAAYGTPQEACYLHWTGESVETDLPALSSSRFRFADLAATVQKQTTDTICALLTDHMDSGLGDRPALYYSGGVALNVTTNQAIAQTNLFDQIFMAGSCEDNGTAIGAALALDAAKSGGRTPEPLTDYHGREYLPAEVQHELASLPVRVTKMPRDEVAPAAAAQIATGAIIGWFQGRSEFGPRALGNRSILANATDPAMPDQINLRVKRRERFRPYAGVTTAESAHQHFTLDGQSPMMLQSPTVTDPGLQAITHADGTCRVQTVTKTENPALHDLLSSIESGPSVAINTSLNGPGEPIVETPTHAALLLLRTELDAVFIEDVLVERE